MPHVTPLDLPLGLYYIMNSWYSYNAIYPAMQVQ